MTKITKGSGDIFADLGVERPAALPPADDELVAKLKARCSYGDTRLWQKHDQLSEEAAARITSLTAEVERLTKELDRCEKIQLPQATANAIAGHMNCMDAFKEVNGRLLKSEASLTAANELLAEAEKVLEPLATAADSYDGVPPPKYFGDTDFQTHYGAGTKSRIVVLVGELRAARALSQRLAGRVK